MSEARKMFEMQANGYALFAKGVKYFGWFFIVFGVVLSITIVGIPGGIACIAMGIFSIYGSKYFAKQAETFKGATSEHAEIIEHQLRQARSQKTE
ncbi:MAG: YccF domain-containing protein [Betaproteobacteria bacterium]|nr:YccF domain-containing protein [Betaproteobacteria bacterium]